MRYHKSVSSGILNMALPASWYALLDPPSSRESQSGSGGESGREPRAQSGSVATFNANPDRTLLRRYRDSGHTSISRMMEGHEVTVPKHNNKPVCLVWALKGECSATCKRKNQHVRYSQATNEAISQLLSDCGVAPAGSS